jgi:hypothetical protein
MSPLTPILFQQSWINEGSKVAGDVVGALLISLSALSLGPVHAIEQETRARNIALLPEQQGQVAQSLMMVMIEIERLSVILACFRRISSRVTDQAYEIQGLSRSAVLADVLFTRFLSFNQPPLVCQ